MAIPWGDFESIVRAHQAMLYRIAFNFCRNAHVAEEVVQEVLLQLYESGTHFKSPAHLQAWLRRATTHRCIDLARQKRSQMETQVEELPEIIEEVSESDPLLNERLRVLVASLPEIQRLVVILRYGEDLSSEEIAAALDMPSPTVRSHLQRALALLREKAPGILGEGIHGPIRRSTS